jgi:hypothetical protein
MTKYRFKTEEEFKAEGFWSVNDNCPLQWNSESLMNEFLGQDIPEKYNKHIEAGHDFSYEDWIFKSKDCILNEQPVELTDVLEELNKLNQNSLINKKTMKKEAKLVVEQGVNTQEKFVYMDKAYSILNVGFQTNKNVVLYGSGE